MAQSTIEWTELTWNPTTGCTKVSAGCKFCYAEVMARRLKAMGVDKYRNGFEVAIHPDALNDPYTWSGRKVVFVNSMSDLFHEEIPDSFIKAVFRVMNDNPQHTFQVLTKRSERLKKLSPSLDWSENIWMGVSVENELVQHRIEDLITCGATTKFLSCEPLIGRLPNLQLKGIDWVIVGGESGWKARPMEQSWVEEIQTQCLQQSVKFFFKQWGGKNKKAAGRMLNGRTWDEMPSKNVLLKSRKPLPEPVAHLHAQAL